MAPCCFGRSAPPPPWLACLGDAPPLWLFRTGRPWSQLQGLWCVSTELSLITLHWFLTAFASVVHIRLLLRLWDLFFYEGSLVLFQTTLGMLRLKVKAGAPGARGSCPGSLLGVCPPSTSAPVRASVSCGLSPGPSGEAPGRREVSLLGQGLPVLSWTIQGSHTCLRPMTGVSQAVTAPPSPLAWPRRRS